jgi:hypothetical protein
MNLFAYFYVLFNAHVIIVTFCFKMSYNYYLFFVDIGTYVGDVPPQHEDEVMEEAEEKHLVVQRPHMLHRLDSRVHLEVEMSYVVS